MLLVFVMALFSIAAFSTEFAAILAEQQTRRNFVGQFRFGVIDLGALMLAGVGAWAAAKAGWQFLDRRAVWLDGELIRFHPTVRRAALPLQAVEAVTHDSGDIQSVLCLHHDGGRRIRVAMVDHDAASAFVTEIEQARVRLSAINAV